jgi:hypothetical protein
MQMSPVPRCWNEQESPGDAGAHSESGREASHAPPRVADEHGGVGIVVVVGVGIVVVVGVGVPVTRASIALLQLSMSVMTDVTVTQGVPLPAWPSSAVVLPSSAGSQVGKVPGVVTSLAWHLSSPFAP